MDLIEDQALEIAILIIRKCKLEKKLRQTFKCILRKMFSCCGMKNIEIELHKINEAIKELNKKSQNKLKRCSSI